MTTPHYLGSSDEPKPVPPVGWRNLNSNEILQADDHVFTGNRFVRTRRQGQPAGDDAIYIRKTNE